MSGIRAIRMKKESYLKNKLSSAINHGKEWEGRDIRYYHLNQKLELEKLKKKDEEEIRTRGRRWVSTGVTGCDVESSGAT